MVVSSLKFGRFFVCVLFLLLLYFFLEGKGKFQMAALIASPKKTKNKHFTQNVMYSHPENKETTEGSSVLSFLKFHSVFSNAFFREQKQIPFFSSSSSSSKNCKPKKE
jgi:hypothetical protein